MKRIFIPLLFLITISCSKHEISEVNNENVNQTKYERLEFSTKEEFNQALDNNESTKAGNFKNLFTIVPNTKGEEVKTYYEKFGYDTLVPNKSFASLLSIKGEISVDNTIYRITPQGTFSYNIEEEEYFNTNFSEISKEDGNKIEEDVYELKRGVKKYDTFSYKTEIKDYVTYDSKQSYNTDDIPWHTFPTYRIEAKTVFGKLWESFIGRTKSYQYKIHKKRRFKTSFYHYNYGVYSEVGSNIELQKKNWIGWSKTNAQEMALEWKNIILETKVPESIAKNFPVLKVPTLLNKYNADAPNYGKKFNTALIVGLTLTDRELQQIIGYSSKTAITYLNNKLGSSSPKIPVTSTNISLHTGPKIVNIVFGDNKRRYNVNSMNQVFMKNVRIGISINPLSLPSSFVGWAKSLVDGTKSLPYPKLKTGVVYTSLKFNNAWYGVRLTKNVEN